MSMDGDLEFLLQQGRRSADKLHEQQVDRTETQNKVLGLAPTRKCDWCLNLYSGPKLDPAQRERLRQVTFTTGGAATLEPDICESCYDGVTGSANRLNNESSLSVGISNSGFPNLLLSRL